MWRVVVEGEKTAWQGLVHGHPVGSSQGGRTLHAAPPPPGGCSSARLTFFCFFSSFEGTMGCDF